MANGFLSLSLAYLIVTCGLCAIEMLRTRTSGPDTISCFMFLFVLQCCIPGIVIFGLLPFVDPAEATGVYAFDRILGNVGLDEGVITLALTAAFAFSLYLGCVLSRALIDKLAPTYGYDRRLELEVRPVRVLIVLAAGLALSVASFMRMGDDMLGRYGQLIMFRAYQETIERTPVNAFAFSLTQSWTWLSVVALFGIIDRRSLRWLLPFCILSLLIFVLLGASRRAFLIPLLMCYLTVVLVRFRWQLGPIIGLALPMLALLAFGKNALSVIAWGGTAQDVASAYASWLNATMRTSTEIGITVLESLGTLHFLDLSPRFGIDHIFAALRIFPEGLLGWESMFPERIVRISTEAFASTYDQDIPPGLFGQMWLDFRIGGPIIWGGLFGVQLGIMQHIYERTRRSRQAAVVFVLVIFLLALPLNSGSFDFTFSIDIVALILALVWCVRLRAQECIPVTVAFSEQIVGEQR